MTFTLRFNSQNGLMKNNFKYVIPTRGEYAGEAAKNFVDVLVAIAEVMPVPALGVALKLAVGIIKACDGNANLERAEELKFRIKTLLVLLVNSIKLKRAEELPAKMMQDIDTLQEDLRYIQTKLREISTQPRILLVFFKTLNEDKVNKCVTKVDQSLERFNLARNIEHTNMLNQLEKQIIAFYTEQKQSCDKIQVTVEDVKALLDERLPLGPMLSTRSRSPIPANSAIFYGRDTIVKELVNIVTGPSRRHICLLGPGGMGKTSLSLAVMCHPEVKAQFADHLRVWVPCVKATSISLFLDTLYSSLAIAKKTGDTRADIFSELKTSPPIVVLLDNLETPWNTIGGQSEVERVLRDIHQIPHVTLFVTMRSSIPPCDDIPWHHVDLRAVDAAASREIYISRNPQSRQDPGLPYLLELIGHMPLAVTLMAKAAKLTGLSANQLMEEYNRLGTPVMGQGLDSETNMDICIGLSVDCPRMKKEPESFDLLCALSMLPTGTSYDMLSNWWTKGMYNITGALSVLKTTSLAEQRGSRYFILPVIQRYVLNPSRFNPNIRTLMIESACTFLKRHESFFGDPHYKTQSAAVSAVEENLEAVLLQATALHPHIIRDGLLLLARHQQHHRPRVDVVQHALKLLHPTKDHILRGDISYCCAGILYELKQRYMSLQHYKEALKHYLLARDRKKAAECRLEISNVLRHRVDNKQNFILREKIIREAQSDYEAIGDEGGVGRCLSYLGLLHRQRNPSAALSFLIQAESILAKVQDQFRHAECTRRLGWGYYWSGQHDLAYLWTMSSLEECERIGNLYGYQWAAHDLGKIAAVCDDYRGSLQHFLRCLQVLKSMGLTSSKALEGMGLAWTRLGKTSDARKAYKQSIRQFSSSGDSGYTEESRNVLLRTEFFLKQLDNPKVSPSIDELSALRMWYTQDHLDRILSPSWTTR